MYHAGGLTRGRGNTDIQRAVWLLLMPAHAEINASMQNNTNVSFETSDQHKESTKSWQSCDTKDTVKVLVNLASRNPFGSDKTLRNIINEMAAEPRVNADNAKDVGAKIIQVWRVVQLSPSLSGEQTK